MAIYLLFHHFNATEGQDGLRFTYLLSKFSKVIWFAPYKRTLSSVQFKIIIVEPFEGPRWVTDAAAHTATGMLTAPIIIQDNFLQPLHIPAPHIHDHSWISFELFLRQSKDYPTGCLYESIIGSLRIRHVNFQQPVLSPPQRNTHICFNIWIST